MATRIYIQGLPPKFSETELRAHFAEKGEITDVKYIKKRKIGFVGYKTPEAANKAVQYFDRNFIRMSRVSVQLARPVEFNEPTNPLKRKRDDFQVEEAPEAPKTETENELIDHDGHMVEDSREETLESNDDWLRARTSRLFGLENEGDTAISKQPAVESKTVVPESGRHDTEGSKTTASVPEKNENINLIKSSRRLFVRNLPYNTTVTDVRARFAQEGSIEEVFLPTGEEGVCKGYAFVLFDKVEQAIEAYRKLDGADFQGRLMHVIGARPHKKHQLDEATIATLPPKIQSRVRRQLKASSTDFNWNSMFMNADAVVSSVANKLGISKSELLDPTSSNATVKQAHAETHVIQDAKQYFEANGVDLAAFNRRERGDKAFLIKNFSYETSTSDLRELLEPYGEISRLLVPPSGTIAIVEYSNAMHARAAFSGLMYRTVKDSKLLLEKAPANLFKAANKNPVSAKNANPTLDAAGADLSDTVTLYVTNLNFTTRSVGLGQSLNFLDGLVSATVRTKSNPKNPGETLSMGFGFLEFKEKEQAHNALSQVNGFVLDGHVLKAKISHKGNDNLHERQSRKTKEAKGTKIIIKNLPFQATKKDVRALFGAYGQLRSVRVPTKQGQGIRGFAFAEFVSPSEAANVMKSLVDTHLYGRKLVLEWAAEEAKDVEEEIERTLRKTGHNVLKVAAQNLTMSERKKFAVEDQEM